MTGNPHGNGSTSAGPQQPVRNEETRRQWRVLFAVGFGTLMSALDASVVNTALPLIKEGLGASVETIQWVVTVYLLGLAGLLLTFGRLGDLRGHRKVYLLGFGVFLAGSACCATAGGVRILILYRAVQSLGAAMIVANSPAILTATFPPTQWGRALGAQATMTYLGLTLGPSLGGWLADQYGWRAIFLINLPIGGIALLASWKFIRPDAASRARAEPFDLPGAALFLAALVSLLAALNKAHDWGWASTPSLLLFAGGAGLGFAFVAVERGKAHAMLDLSLFRSRIFASAVGSAVMNYVAVSSIIFLLPFYLIPGRGFSASHAGLLMTVQSLVMAAVSPISGSISDRVGSRTPALTGLLLSAFGLFLLSRVGASTPLTVVAAALVLTGLGNGVFVAPNNSALMGAAPKGRQGLAAGMMATARVAGMALGVGVAGAVLTTVQARMPAADASTRLIGGVDAGFLTAAAVALAACFVTMARGGTNRRAPAS
jgi:EmrB/QacA subfamily drug resistance transporter